MLGTLAGDGTGRSQEPPNRAIITAVRVDDRNRGQRVIDTGCTRLELGEDGVVRISNSLGAEIGLAEAEQNIAAIQELGGSAKLLLLVDGSNIRAISREARCAFARAELLHVVAAQAIFVRSGIGKVIANFFLGLNRPPFPTRLFTDEGEAVAWLVGHRG